MGRKLWMIVTSCIVGAGIITNPVIANAETIKVDGGSVTYETNENGTTDITFSKDGGWTDVGKELEFKYSDGSDFILDDYVRQDNGDITVTTVGEFDINNLIVEFYGDPPAPADTQAADPVVENTAPSGGDNNAATANDSQATDNQASPSENNSENTTRLERANESALFVINPSEDTQSSFETNSGDDQAINSSGDSSGAPADAFSPSDITYESLNSDARRAIESRMSYNTFTSLCTRAIATVGENQTLTINTGKWLSIDRKTMEAIAARPDMAVTINYVYNEKAYSVTIPVGYDVMSLLDENGYCGFLYLNKIFGAKEL